MRCPTRARRSTAGRGTRSRGRAPSRTLVGQQLGPPLAERLEGVPKLGLGRSLVERRVDVRDHERLYGRGEALELARLELHGIREREVERIDEADRALAHRHDQLRLDDMQ